MANFGDRSTANLATCRPELVRVAQIVIVHFDFAVICGQRGREEQERAFLEGYSKVHWPESKHNTEPLSEAFDLAPYPIDWDDRDRFVLLAGHVLQAGYEAGIEIVWGGDWNRNNIIKDERFQDLGHFQLKVGS